MGKRSPCFFRRKHLDQQVFHPLPPHTRSCICSYTFQMEEARHHTSRSHSRSRSRSPARHEEKRSGHHHHHRHHHARRRSHSDSPRHGGSSSRSSQLPPLNKPLPLNARQLSKHDLPTHRPMFALYLDIQKRIDIDELDGTEIKGRWKSFVSKWYHIQISPSLLTTRNSGAQD